MVIVTRTSLDVRRLFQIASQANKHVILNLVTKFSKSEAIKFGWDTTKKNIKFFVILLILVWIINLIPRFLSSPVSFVMPKGIIDDSYFMRMLFAVIFILIIAMITWFLKNLVDIGLIKIALKFHGNQKPVFGDLFSGTKVFWQYIAGSILYGLIVIAGFLLLIIPGIIWSIKFQYYSYLIIDKGLGPVEALKQSSKITQGIKWDLFVFNLALIGVIVLGFLALFIGLFWAVPTNMLATAYVYKKLSQT